VNSDDDLSKNGNGNFAMPTKPELYTDGREKADWTTRYPTDAIRGINFEACILVFYLIVLMGITGLLLGLNGQSVDFPLSGAAAVQSNGAAGSLHLHIDFNFLLTCAVGSLGGTMFSIKWLIHAVAKCKWHLDRRYWRLLVPLMGGVYACVLLTLLDGGLLGSQSSGSAKSVGLSAAYAFMVGYFSDGVSGLLSNLANAIFGTIDKK
jgi:hypothetical protein